MLGHFPKTTKLYLLILLCFFMCNEGQLQASFIKLGVHRFISQVSYMSMEEDAQNNTEISTVSYTGQPYSLDYTLELIPFPFLGFEINSNAEPGQHSFELDSPSNYYSENQISQTIQTQILSGVNLYFGNNNEDGWKPFLGLMKGTLMVNNKKLGSEETETQNDINSEVELNISTQMFKVGVDYIYGVLGIRLQFLSYVGKSEAEVSNNGSTSNETIILGNGLGAGVFLFW